MVKPTDYKLWTNKQTSSVQLFSHVECTQWVPVGLPTHVPWRSCSIPCNDLGQRGRAAIINTILIWTRMTLQKVETFLIEDWAQRHRKSKSVFSSQLLPLVPLKLLFTYHLLQRLMLSFWMKLWKCCWSRPSYNIYCRELYWKSK